MGLLIRKQSQYEFDPHHHAPDNHGRPHQPDLDYYLSLYSHKLGIYIFGTVSMAANMLYLFNDASCLIFFFSRDIPSPYNITPYEWFTLEFFTVNGNESFINESLLDHDDSESKYYGPADQWSRVIVNLAQVIFFTCSVCFLSKMLDVARRLKAAKSHLAVLGLISSNIGVWFYAYCSETGFGNVMSPENKKDVLQNFSLSCHNHSTPVDAFAVTVNSIAYPFFMEFAVVAMEILIRVWFKRIDGLRGRGNEETGQGGQNHPQQEQLQGNGETGQGGQNHPQQEQLQGNGETRQGGQNHPQQEQPQGNGETGQGGQNHPQQEQPQGNGETGQGGQNHPQQEQPQENGETGQGGQSHPQQEQPQENGETGQGGQNHPQQEQPQENGETGQEGQNHPQEEQPQGSEETGPEGQNHPHLGQQRLRHRVTAVWGWMISWNSMFTALLLGSVEATAIKFYAINQEYVDDNKGYLLDEKLQLYVQIPVSLIRITCNLVPALIVTAHCTMIAKSFKVTRHNARHLTGTYVLVGLAASSNIVLYGFDIIISVKQFAHNKYYADSISYALRTVESLYIVQIGLQTWLIYLCKTFQAREHAQECKCKQCRFYNGMEGLMGYLVMFNFCRWIINSFLESDFKTQELVFKNVESPDELKETWTSLVHLCIPLAAYFRFVSCFLFLEIKCMLKTDDTANIHAQSGDSRGRSSSDVSTQDYVIPDEILDETSPLLQIN